MNSIDSKWTNHDWPCIYIRTFDLSNLAKWRSNGIKIFSLILLRVYIVKLTSILGHYFKIIICSFLAIQTRLFATLVIHPSVPRIDSEQGRTVSGQTVNELLVNALVFVGSTNGIGHDYFRPVRTVFQYSSLVIRRSKYRWMIVLVVDYYTYLKYRWYSGTF